MGVGFGGVDGWVMVVGRWMDGGWLWGGGWMDG